MADPRRIQLDLSSAHAPFRANINSRAFIVIRADNEAEISYSLDGPRLSLEPGMYRGQFAEVFLWADGSGAAGQIVQIAVLQDDTRPLEPGENRLESVGALPRNLVVTLSSAQSIDVTDRPARAVGVVELPDDPTRVLGLVELPDDATRVLGLVELPDDPTREVGRVTITEPEPFADEALAAGAAAVALTAATYADAVRAVVTVNAESIRYRLRGAADAPTDAIGHLVAAGDRIELRSAAEIAAFRMIRVAATDADVHVTYYH